MNTAVFALAVAGLAVPLSFAATVHKIDFDSPDVGSYQILFGSPTVVSDPTGSLSGNVLRLQDGAGSLEQISFAVASGTPAYRIGFDLYVQELFTSPGFPGDAFTLFLDTPDVRFLQFQNGDTPTLMGPTIRMKPDSASPVTIGTFTNQTKYEVQVDVYDTLSQWDIRIDGSLAASGAFGASGTDINAVRFGLSEQSVSAAAGDGTVYLDNIHIQAIPEPSAAALLFVGLAPWLLRRARA